MPNYQNAKIYKLICSKTNRVYIGSTTTKLKYRKLQHKHSGNKCTSKEFINAKIYLLEDYPCNNKLELHSKEREYIENTDCVNMVLPCRTDKEQQEYHKAYKKEYHEKNKETIKKQTKEYREKNKEIIKKQAKEYYENNKEEINKKHKKYNEENKEKKKKQAKEYYEKNKEIIKKKMICECGGKFTRSNKLRHFKSKKHQIYTIKNLT